MTPNDPRLTFDPQNDRGSQTYTYVWVTRKYYENRRVNAFKWKYKFDHCDPKWPQVNIWPHKIGRGSQTDKHVWVLWSCYVTWTIYSIFSVNGLLTPVTPNNPRLTFDPIKSQEGLKLIILYKGLHHYYTLHRLFVQIEVPSRGSISKKKLVCLYKFGMIFFRRMFSTTYLKMR